MSVSVLLAGRGYKEIQDQAPLLKGATGEQILGKLFS